MIHTAVQATDEKRYATLRAAAALRGISVDRFTEEDGGVSYVMSIGIWLKMAFSLDSLETELEKMGVTV